MLSANDVAHLDALPLEQGTRRRPARKTLSDIRYLMNYVESKIREARQWTEEHNPTTVTEMNHAVEEHFVIRGDGCTHQRRDSQIKWSTMVLFLRKRLASKQQT
jgi:glycosidase